MDKEHQLNENGSSRTALQHAAEENNIAAARILLDKGAAIDKPNSDGKTALFMSDSPEMATMLVRRGASFSDHFSRDIYGWLGWDLELFEDMISVYSDRGGKDTRITNPSPLTALSDTRGSIECEEADIHPSHLVAILKARIDLHEDSGSERSLMHLAILNRTSSTFVLNSSSDLKETAPFPWHLVFWTQLSFMDSMFTHFRRKIGEKRLARIAHLQPTRGWSPLCRAAADHKTCVIQNCISLGADLDFEGCPHGSALVVASACGYLEVVRILVRAGASLSYHGQHGHKSVFDFCRSKVVRNWLLVDRFREHRTIDVRSHWGYGQETRPWAGTAVARLKLVGDRAMCCHETMMDYAERLAEIRKEWRGTVIPRVCMDGIIYW